ncbi:MAG: uroporphyrinogen-III C-methyltransferase [Burkholderiales bacterium]|nr:uroporphyrinogen-III C-methyltransferase [Burkholderiales bacterium]
MNARVASARAMLPGMVYLVGAGPGDPELLTLRAAKLLNEAEVIVYDHLVSAPILEMGNSGAQRIYAGKERGNHTLVQSDLNQLLVRLAREGKRVIRLKGGDPFIFGRGGEEVEALAAAGIAFEVVPGITAACGVAAYAGIPLTHRDHANSCLFVAGHLKDGSIDLDWDFLARPGRTLVVYMGLLGLSTLCGKLVAHGVPETTPAAIIQHGTTSSQKTVAGTLATLPQLAQSARLAPPTLIIIGDVVRLHAQLDWYESAAVGAGAD